MFTDEQLQTLRAAGFDDETIAALTALVAAGGEPATAGVRMAAAQLERAERSPENVNALGVLADVSEGLTAAAPPPAARPTPGQVGARRPAANAPRAPEGQAGLGSVRQRVFSAAGVPINDQRELAAAFERAVRSGRQGVPSLVASVRTELPEGRQLTRDDVTNEALVVAALSPAALVAAGGLCAPLPAIYDLFGVGSAERPLREGLPTFGAERGGVQLRRAVQLGDVGGSVGVWTVQNDVDAGTAGLPDPTKAIITATCPPVDTVQVQAITRRVRFGNLQSRFDPESVSALLDATLVAHARLAEQELLRGIAAASVAVTVGARLGATRDLLTDVERAAVAYRSRHRMSPAAVLRVILPDWARGLLRSDLARQLPGDNTLAVTDGQLAEYLSVRGIRPIYSLDAQVFGAQAVGPLLGWPATVTWTLFPEGSFLYLDGGELDLGVVRDSALNAVNSAEVFAETFEAVAFRGPQALQVTSTVSATGAVSGTVVPAA